MNLAFPSPRGLAAPMALAAALCAAPALAQTRAALVQSVDEPGRNPYQETQPNLTCRGTTVCGFEFGVVPAGKRLVVTHIAGLVDTGAGTSPHCVLYSGFGGNEFTSLPFTGVRGATWALGVRYYFAHNVLAYYGPGEPVRAVCQSLADTMSGVAQLMLTGHYVNLP